MQKICDVPRLAAYFLITKAQIANFSVLGTDSFSAEQKHTEQENKKIRLVSFTISHLMSEKRL